MYSAPQLAIKYLRYYLTASNGKGHGIHSPFIFQFITRVLNDHTQYKEYDKVEKLRQQFLNDRTVLTIQDFGAGSSVSKTNQRSVASIAKNASKSKKLAQLLFRMVRLYQPSSILELGTSLGITTAYLSLAKPDAKLLTLEGAGAVAALAEKNFLVSGFQDISVVKGNFDDTLSVVLEGLPTVCFAFIDGNHRKEPTEKYFSQLLAKINNESILVFDDIHWSREMEQAWETIRNHPSVRCTIDLFFIGIVFFRQEFHEKQHFVIRY